MRIIPSFFIAIACFLAPTIAISQSEQISASLSEVLKPKSVTLFNVLIEENTGQPKCGMNGPGKFLYEGWSLEHILPNAYDTSTARILINGELPTGKYNFSVTAPNADREQVCRLAQTAIESSFNLQVKEQSILTDVYVMSFKKLNSENVTQSSATTEKSRWGLFKGDFLAIGISTSAFASWLERTLGKPIVDQTGIGYNLDFEFPVASLGIEPTVENSQQIIETIKEYLGLEFTETTLETDMIVVECPQSF